MWEEYSAQTTAVKLLHNFAKWLRLQIYLEIKFKIYVNTYRIIHDNGFTFEELMAQRSAIYSSIIDAMICLLNGMETFE